MNLTLSDNVRKLIDAQVSSGRFATREDVVVAALLSLDQQAQMAEFEAAFPGLNAKVEQGVREARDGKLIGEAFFEELDREEADNASPTGRKTA